MTEIAIAFSGARIFNGQELLEDHALCVDQNGQFTVRPSDALPSGCVTQRLPGGVITPGFVDMQVNGGGGVMFNDDQSVDALRTMAKAHATIGTAALLPTLITDTPERSSAAIEAVAQAIAEKVKGIVGIHLEGPHLSVARKGAHDPQLIRSMNDDDLRMVLDAANSLPNVMMTVAPENTAFAQIKAMAEAGVIVSLGHTDAGYETCMRAFDAGACCTTHLFNAMSQMTSRDPGLVGATLAWRPAPCADLELPHALSVMIGLGDTPSTALARATATPVALLRDLMGLGGFTTQRFILQRIGQATRS